MKSQSNIIQPTIWVRELKNGIRHITLRKNFNQITIQNNNSINNDTNDITTETQYEYDETDIYISDRDNIEDYINANFDILFNKSLDNFKDNRIKELSELCNTSILSGFDSKAKDGVNIKHYDFDTDSQTNIMGIQVGIMGAMLKGNTTNFIIEWKNSEQIKCENDWTIPQFIALCQDAEVFKTSLIKKYHDLKENVINAQSEDEIKGIIW